MERGDSDEKTYVPVADGAELKFATGVEFREGIFSTDVDEKEGAISSRTSLSALSAFLLLNSVPWPRQSSKSKSEPNISSKRFRKDDIVNPLVLM